MITIKMHQGKFRIEIGDEIWEFKDLKEMQENLNRILIIKDKFGRIKQAEKKE